MTERPPRPGPGRQRIPLPTAPTVADPASGQWVRPGRMRVTAPFAALIAGAAGGGVLAANDPATAGWLPRCPLHAMTGLWCPGCGLTRAAYSLTRGDLIGATGHNALWPVFAALAAGAWTTWAAAAMGRRTPAFPSRIGARTWVGLGALLVAFGVARNLPVAGLRALAP